VRLKSWFSFFKGKIRKATPDHFWLLLGRYRRKFFLVDYSERDYRAQSKSSDKAYFVIRREPPGAGLFSNLNHVIQGLYEAERRNLVPIVDMANYWTEYSQPSKYLGTRNAWEYFFEQTDQVTLKQVYKAQNYILSKGNRIVGDDWLADKSLKYVLDPIKNEKIGMLFRRYIHLNKHSRFLLNETKNYLDWNPSKTLGVSLRGTDYLSIEPHGHPRQPELIDVISEVHRRMSSNEFESIFLATEDSHIRREFEKEFSGALIKDFRNSEFFERIVPRNMKMKPAATNGIVNTYAYLVETYLLSETYSCIASLANGSAAAIAINCNEYMEPTFLYLGTY